MVIEPLGWKGNWAPAYYDGEVRKQVNSVAEAVIKVKEGFAVEVLTLYQQDTGEHVAVFIDDKGEVKMFKTDTLEKLNAERDKYKKKV